MAIFLIMIKWALKYNFGWGNNDYYLAAFITFKVYALASLLINKGKMLYYLAAI